jgi:hypothetical protein
MPVIKTPRMGLDRIEKLLRDGLRLTEVSKLSGYPVPTISFFAKAWKIPMKMGRPKKAE